MVSHKNFKNKKLETQLLIILSLEGFTFQPLPFSKITVSLESMAALNLCCTTSNCATLGEFLHSRKSHFSRS